MCNFYRPQGEGSVFTCVCLPTIILMANLSLLGLVTARSVCILLECFLVFRFFFVHERTNSCPFIVLYHWLEINFIKYGFAHFSWLHTACLLQIVLILVKI